MSKEYHYDVLVIGSGAAGLTMALNVADRARVAVLSKGELTAGSTWMAQGGIAGVVDPEDNTEDHIRDTFVAGSDLCHMDAVRCTVENGARSIDWLLQQGVKFTREKDGHLHLTKEGGHSHRRIVHADDATGRAIAETLQAKAQRHSNIDLHTHSVAVDLITRRKLGLPDNRCIGAYVLDQKSGHVKTYLAPFVVLATGGASKAYLYTSNTDGASGDGIAMAWRAGCRVANMEFNQFHPTCLYHPQAKSFLISEAVRGEGGRLLLPDGSRFMPRFDKREELAPRDVVARAIDHEMKRLGCDCVYLDISHKPAEFVKSHFPTIFAKCQEYGIDITKDPIPVVPAAHYTCGGVMTNTKGQTDIEGLYAVGETSFTGLHGANRLASNSLLECIVFGTNAANDILEHLDEQDPLPKAPFWDESQVTDSDEDVVLSHNWDELRRFMWDYVGIVRTDKRLQRALNRIRMLQQEISDYYSNYKISKDLLEVRNLAIVSELIIRSAMLRKESRGLHYTLNYPDLAPEQRDTVLTPINYDWPNN